MTPGFVPNPHSVEHNIQFFCQHLDIVIKAVSQKRVWKNSFSWAVWRNCLWMLITSIVIVYLIGPCFTYNNTIFIWLLMNPCHQGSKTQCFLFFVMSLQDPRRLQKAAIDPAACWTLICLGKRWGCTQRLLKEWVSLLSNPRWPCVAHRLCQHTAATGRAHVCLRIWIGIGCYERQAIFAKNVLLCPSNPPFIALCGSDFLFPHKLWLHLVPRHRMTPHSREQGTMLGELWHPSWTAIYMYWVQSGSIVQWKGCRVE